MNLNLEIDEGLVARIDEIASVQKTSRELSVIAALQSWYAHPKICDFGDFATGRAIAMTYLLDTGTFSNLARNHATIMG